MFEFDVEIEGDVGAVDPVALLVGTLVFLLDLGGQPAILLAVLDLVKFLILLGESLARRSPTPTSRTRPSSSPIFSPSSRISARLISFFRYFFQNYSL
jgi:hypothetical protein